MRQCKRAWLPEAGDATATAASCGRLPAAVNLATAILVIVTSVTVVFVVPTLITDLTSDRTVGIGAVLLAAVHVAVTLAVLVLSVLVRRGRRRAWQTLVWLLVLDAVTGPIRLGVERDDELSATDLPIALASATVTLVFVALLVAPRSSRAYFRAQSVSAGRPGAAQSR